MRDWAIPEPGSLAPRHEAIRVYGELAGLILEHQPIPWNADAVVVEAGLKLPTTVRRKEDFRLHLARGQIIAAESLRIETPGGVSVVRFRFPPPDIGGTVELHFRDRSLGRTELSVLDRDVFVNSLRLRLPTLHARLGNETVACQTFVASQCAGLTVAGLLSAPTSLAPLMELGVGVEIRGASDEPLTQVAVPLSGGQMLHQEALLTAYPRNLPRRSGDWKVIWRAGARELATVHAKAIAPAKFRRSLHLVGTRWIIDDGTGVRFQPNFPKDVRATRVGPCFLVASREPGMAARARFEIVAHLINGRLPQSLDVLVTDGPTLITPGTAALNQLADVQAFELNCHGRSLGVLSIHPVPSAKFDAEGGFRPAVDFAWNANADEELNERLRRLMTTQNPMR